MELPWLVCGLEMPRRCHGERMLRSFAMELNLTPEAIDLGVSAFNDLRRAIILRLGARLGYICHF